MRRAINLSCPINPTTGYGITSTNIAIALSALDIDVACFPIGRVSIERAEQKNPIVNSLNSAQFYNRDNPCLKIWHQHDLSSRIGTGDYYVMPFFELDRLHPSEIHQINQTDGIFTPTKWSKKVLVDNGVSVPVYVAPLGVDTNVFQCGKIRFEEETYKFIHVGKWELRKSQDFLLNAFEKAFGLEDNVELWLFPHNPFLKPEEEKQWHDLVSKNKLAQKIRVYERIEAQSGLADAISQADCGIFMSRAEGWNNEIPEVMALNKPIIATNYSAHTEYCTKENSFLVDVDETEPANDGKWFHGHGNWAKLGEKQLEQTINYMRFVYTNNVRVNPNGLETAKKYSWDNTASIIHQTLLENDSYNVKRK